MVNLCKTMKIKYESIPVLTAEKHFNRIFLQLNLKKGNKMILVQSCTQDREP